MYLYLKKRGNSSYLRVQISQFTKLVGYSRVFVKNIHIFTTQCLK